MNWNRFFIKLDRLSGWVLLILMILFIVSGYGMTKEITNPIKAKYLHEVLLPIPMFIFFMIHVGWQIRLSLIRWKWGSRQWINFYVLIISLVLFVFFLWLYLV